MKKSTGAIFYKEANLQLDTCTNVGSIFVKTGLLSTVETEGAQPVVDTLVSKSSHELLHGQVSSQVMQPPYWPSLVLATMP